jgi:hypothetical protein
MRPQLQGDRSVVTQMRELERAASSNAPLGLHVAAMWNELIYLERPLTWLDTPEQAEPGSLVLVDAAARQRLAQTAAFDELAHQEIRQRRQLSLLRVAGTAETSAGDRPAGSTGSARDSR